MSRYKELEFADNPRDPAVRCDIGFDTESGKLDITVTNIINMQDESCYMGLDADQARQIINMLTAGLKKFDENAE